MNPEQGQAVGGRRRSGRLGILHVGDEREHDRERGENQEGHIEDSAPRHGGIIRQVGYTEPSVGCNGARSDALGLEYVLVHWLLAALARRLAAHASDARRAKAQQQAAEAATERAPAAHSRPSRRSPWPSPSRLASPRRGSGTARPEQATGRRSERPTAPAMMRGRGRWSHDPTVALIPRPLTMRQGGRGCSSIVPDRGIRSSAADHGGQGRRYLGRRGGASVWRTCGSRRGDRSFAWERARVTCAEGPCAAGGRSVAASAACCCAFARAARSDA